MYHIFFFTWVRWVSSFSYNLFSKFSCWICLSADCKYNHLCKEIYNFLSNSVILKLLSGVTQSVQLLVCGLCDSGFGVRFMERATVFFSRNKHDQSWDSRSFLSKGTKVHCLCIKRKAHRISLFISI